MKTILTIRISQDTIQQFLLFTVLLLAAQHSSAQVDRKVAKELEKKLIVNGRETASSEVLIPLGSIGTVKTTYIKKDLFYPKIVSDFGLRNVIKKDMELVLFGDQSPVTGFLLDLSGKTSAKISGRIPTKKDITTWEFEAGQKDDNIPLFEQGKYNGSIDIAYNWYIIRKDYRTPIQFSSNRYTFINGGHKIVQPILKLRYKQLNENMLDSAQILMNIIKARNSESPDILVKKFEDAICVADRELVEAGIVIDDPETLTTIQNLLSEALIDNYKQYSKKYSSQTSLSSATSLGAINNIIKADPDFKIDLLIEDTEKILRRLGIRPQLIADAEVEAAKNFWITKRLTWLSISPTAGFKAYKLYGKDKSNNILEEPESKAFASAKINIWYSLYWIRKKGADLLRFGLEPVFGNNLKNYTEIKYYEQDTLQVQSNGNVVMKEKTTDGLYRTKDSKIEHKLFWNFRVEYFRLPKRNFVPGFSIKLYSMRDGILEKNSRKLRPQAGLVLNLLNQDKTKAVITLQPYVVYDNLLREAITTSVGMVRSVNFKEKFGAGITLGLPIKGLLSISE